MASGSVNGFVNVFPYHSETLVSSYGRGQVMDKIASVTQEVDFPDSDFREKNPPLFNGNLYPDEFRISLKVGKADSFLPLIFGKVETTANGSILFLEYRLFPSSVFFLGFWGLITLVLAAFFYFAQSQSLYSLISIVIGAGNFAFAWFNFNRKVEQSRKIFRKIL